MCAVSVSLSVTLLNSASLCKNGLTDKMLFGVNTPGAYGTLCYTGVLIPPQTGRRPTLKFLDPPRISEMAALLTCLDIIILMHSLSLLLSVA